MPINEIYKIIYARIYEFIFEICLLNSSKEINFYQYLFDFLL